MSGVVATQRGGSPHAFGFHKEDKGKDKIPAFSIEGSSYVEGKGKEKASPLALEQLARIRASHNEEDSNLPFLPNELLLRILRFADASVLAVFSVTSKVSNQVIQYEGFWKGVYLSRFPDAPLPEGSKYDCTTYITQLRSSHLINGNCFSSTLTKHSSGFKCSIIAGKKIYEGFKNGKIRAWDPKTGNSTEVQGYTGKDRTKAVIALIPLKRQLITNVPSDRKSTHLPQRIADDPSDRKSAHLSQPIASGPSERRSTRLSQLFANGPSERRSARLSQLIASGPSDRKSANPSRKHFSARKLMSISNTGQIKVWDARTLACLEIHQVLLSEQCCFAVTSQHLYVGDNRGNINKWNLKDWSFKQSPDAYRYTITALLSAKQKLLAATTEGVIAVWRTKNLKSLRVRLGHVGVVYSLAYAKGRFYSGSADQTIRVWNAKTLDCVGILAGHTDAVYSVAVRNGLLFSGAKNGELRLWNAETGECLRTFTNHQPVVSLSFLYNYKLILGTEQGVKIWDFQAPMKTYDLLRKTAKQLSRYKKAALSGFYQLPPGTINAVFSELICKKEEAKERKPSTVQIVKAIRRHLCRRIAYLFLGGARYEKLAMQRFSGLPKKIQGGIYSACYDVLEPFSKGYYGCGREAFRGEKGSGKKATLEQRAQAIFQYLDWDRKQKREQLSVDNPQASIGENAENAVELPLSDVITATLLSSRKKKLHRRRVSCKY